MAQIDAMLDDKVGDALATVTPNGNGSSNEQRPARKRASWTCGWRGPARVLSSG